MVQEFTINELFIGVCSIITSIGGLCLIIFKSRCTDISICGIKCKRKLQEIDENTNNNNNTNNV